MTQDWNRQLYDQGLSADAGSFGDLAGELASARDGAIAAPLLDLGLIRASGADAAEFLHNLLTNDVKGLGAGDARLAGLCTAKGRLLAVVLAWREGEDVLLLLPRDILPAVLKKLTMYVLRAKVKLRDATPETALIGYSADSAPPLPGLAAELPRYGVAAVPHGKAIRLDSRRWLLAVEASAAPEAWSVLGTRARPVGLAAWRWLEIGAGQPRVEAATQEAFVPQMLNMELPAVAGVSFTKGCYPGQEIVARTQYLGKVKRRMFRARSTTPAAPGALVYSPDTGEQHCGAIVSSAPSPDGGFECLVCTQIAARDSGIVTVGSPQGERLEFLPLPYAPEDPAA